MKTILTFLGAALILYVAPLRAGLILQPNDMLAICGDSITEETIYSGYMEDYFLMCQPVEGLRVAQFGKNGGTARAFYYEMGIKLMPFKPTVATLCFGMNDGGYLPFNKGTGAEYGKALQDAIERLKKSGVKTILVGSPGCVDPAPGLLVTPAKTSADEYNKTLGALKDIAQQVATTEGVGFVDIHTPMMDVMAKAKAAYGDKYLFVAGGGIHPGFNGSLVMAHVFLKGLGCDGAIGTITADLGAGTAEGTPGQKIVSCKAGTIEVESSRYPFCFVGPPDKSNQTALSVVNFFPFNEDLNRYMLVVKGLKGSKAKVTWGTVTKEFSATDLGKGVNLAAEFPVNPFCAQFAKVDAAVHAQQLDEITLGMNFLQYLPTFKTMAPNSIDSFDKIVADSVGQDQVLFKKAADLVVPVQHTITIESEP